MPPGGELAAWVVAVLTALALVVRYVGRPITRGIVFVRDRLDDIREVVEQLRDVVQYVGLLGADVEARLDRIERLLELGPYDPRHAVVVEGHTSPLHDVVRERIRTAALIRDVERQERAKNRTRRQQDDD